MDTGGSITSKLGSDSQDSDDLPQPGSSGHEPSKNFPAIDIKITKNVANTSKGVEQAKKRLRAFSIQKKTSLSPVTVPKPISTGSATVLIGKATGVKMLPKPDPDPAVEPKKPPKPPKPGTKQPQESYILTQKKTLADIEDMKRKMELVELGIPLGLICPHSDKAMPTKAMPPIKTFLDSDKVDELICEAKKAKAEGKEFKFDYRKLLPDYANPFQRNKNPSTTESKEISVTPKADEKDRRKSRNRDKRRTDKTYDSRKYHSHKWDRDRHKEDKYHDKSSERDENIKEGEKHKNTVSKYKDSRYKEKDDKSKERDNISKEKDEKKSVAKDDSIKVEKEAEVDLKDFVVCDSWSDNEDKSKDSTPKLDEIKKRIEEKVKEKTPILVIDPMEQLRESLGRKEKKNESPKPKLQRLNPVRDAFKFEVVEPEDDEVLDIFDENSGLEKYSKVKCKIENTSPDDMQIFDYDDRKEETFEGMADDTFLESVINEIKQEELDDTSQDKGLVEYDESPSKDGEIRSVTPEIDDRVSQISSSRSDYSDGYKSTESGYKSTDSLKISDYKSDSELERIVEERKRELERMVVERKMSKYTVDSLETWSFVLKICQPLLFRHDRNKCYKETRITPKLWYTENPKLCNCVKDRSVVYEELDMRKMELVDVLYNEKQLSESGHATSRGWYPRAQQWPPCSESLRTSDEWEAEDSQPARVPLPAKPRPGGDMSLDQEYQRFMEAVWPEVVEAKSETPRTSPVRREKKKADDDDERKAKKAKTSSEGWSQESDVEEVDKSDVRKAKPEKGKRKRKHSTSTSVTDSSESEPKKRKKMHKKKYNKTSKSKDAKRRRISKKNIKKLKEKQKKKKKVIQIDEDSDLQDVEKEKKKKDKTAKRKKQLKQKKKTLRKKKAKARSSSSSDSTSDSESEPDRRSKKKKKSSEKKKKHKKSFETQEELFDVNILKNIKTERNTDDELSKEIEFSPRRQKPREIINVKELQNDFVGNSIQIKKEIEHDEGSKQKVEVGKEVVSEKKEESQDSQAGNAEGTESQPQSKFKDKDESQSTPQLPPDESNHSQASSQESVYSHKDAPVYEKDESHLRPSSQNSNYSFHDVIASGMYSKTMEHAKPEIPVEHDSHNHEITQRRESDVASLKHNTYSGDSDISYDHNAQSHDRRLESNEQEIRSHEHQLQRHETDIKSQPYSREHDMSHEHDVQCHERPLQSIEHAIQSHEHKLQSNQHGMQSHEHKPQSNQHSIESHEHKLQSNQHGIQSYEHKLQSNQHGMQSHEHKLQSNQHGMQIHEHKLQSNQHAIQSHEHKLQNNQHRMQRDEHKLQSNQHGMQSYKHKLQSNQHGIQSHEHKLQRNQHGMQNHKHEMSHEHEMQTHEHDLDSQEYEQGNYEMYEQMAMAYQSDVASQHVSPPGGSGERRIETVVRARTCGEIKCDWRAGEGGAPVAAPARPSRWGLKPGDVNIVLTGGEQSPAPRAVERVYKIESIANRTDTSSTGYDEAYMDMYGASDKLQYGDCFSTEEQAAGSAEARDGEEAPGRATITPRVSSLDKRISLTLRTTVLGDVVKDMNESDDKDGPDKGILVTKSSEGRAAKRVSFADGYKPGQDSDVEEPPVKKRKKPRRLGCAWPCPATHPDHVPLWDALPPPPPPPGSPPPPAPAPPPPTHLLRQGRPTVSGLLPPHHTGGKFDPSSLPAFMPPEPPPGLLSFQNL